MPTAKRWQLWVRDDNDVWTVVTSDLNKHDAQTEAVRKNAALRRLGALETLKYRALPIGVVPHNGKEKR